MASGVLLIEDERVFANNIRRYLSRSGYEIVIASSAEEGLNACRRKDFDLVLLDLNLPDLHGLEVLRRLRQRDPRLKVVCVTGNGMAQIAADVMKAGAHDYVAKPVVLSELKILVDRALSQGQLEGVPNFRKSRDDSNLTMLLGQSPAMRSLRARISSILEAERSLVDGTPPAVLIRGETGTGKELVARALHFDGPRRAAPFIELNCATLPAHLLESELFGYGRSDRTDARHGKIGLVEAAHGGTLFLNEIGDTDPAVQLKLLRLLEERTVSRVGGIGDSKVDVRFVSATNRPLEELVQTGRFRADLYYRIRAVTIDMPPLRARVRDSEVLAQHFLDHHAQRYGRSGIQFSAGALERICGYSWPGNVRELRNVVEQALLSAPGNVIAEDYLEISAISAATLPNVAALPTEERNSFNSSRDAVQTGLTLNQAERSLIERALSQSKGNVTQAAKILGISRDTLRYRIDKHGLG